MATTVTAKGQVTIPKPIREFLGIGPGSVVDFKRAADGSVVVVTAHHTNPPNRVERRRGHGGPGPSTDENIALVRGDE